MGNRDNLKNFLADIRACSTEAELLALMQKIAETYGFSGFNFLKTDNVGNGVPYYAGSIKKGWQAAYRDNNFERVDPCLARSLKSAVPFSWSEVRPSRKSGPKPAAARLFEAARDFRYTDGFVVPHAFTDQVGRHRSALLLFVWEHDPATKMQFMLSEARHDLHVISIYWISRAVAVKRDIFLASDDAPIPLGAVRLLSDRERQALTFAARGLTIPETSERMKVAEATVEAQLRSAYEKLGARNKTHAAIRALHLGWIEL